LGVKLLHFAAYGKNRAQTGILCAAAIFAACPLYAQRLGRVAEWFKAAVLKVGRATNPE
jgi:hypothetical protein